jgi:hypothetical protein
MSLPFEEVMILEGFAHIGRICRACKGAYFEQVSNDKAEKSGIVDSRGSEIIIQ